MGNFANISVSYEIPREMNTAENLTRNLPFWSFSINVFFFLKLVTKKTVFTKNSYQKFDKIILN